MTPDLRRAYDGPVDVLPSRASRWIAAGLGVLLVVCAAFAAPAAAETSSFDVGDQAVVIVQIAGRGNDLVVHTWDRSTVQIESMDVPPAVDRRSVVVGTEKIPLVAPIPPMQYLRRENGQDVDAGTLPPEEFPYAAFRPGPHDVVRVVAEAGSHLVVTVPSSTGLLQTRVGAATTTIEGYHGANLLVAQGFGRVRLSAVATTAFVQMNGGALRAVDSTFERVRFRSNAAHAVFERCRSKQIEATTISGSMVYDGGTFDPGLAHFESQTGSIALGAAGPAQLTARAQDGHVYTSVDPRNGSVDQRADGAATATVGSGGALVNAISGRGNVYLYDGTLASRRALAPEWRPVHQLFTGRRRVPPQGSPSPHPLTGRSHVRLR